MYISTRHRDFLFYAVGMEMMKNQEHYNHSDPNKEVCTRKQLGPNTVNSPIKAPHVFFFVWVFGVPGLFSYNYGLISAKNYLIFILEYRNSLIK